MELVCGSSVNVALLSCLLYLCLLTTSPVSGDIASKCKGRWAVHACWGGNGKRSDPSLDMTSGQSLGLSNRLTNDALLLRVLQKRLRPLSEPFSEDTAETRQLVSRGEDLVPRDRDSELKQLVLRYVSALLARGNDRPSYDFV